jgi:glycosyltransferase involved in cell wall biosynthesis
VRARGLRRGAEVGVAFGGHSENILQNTEVERLYGVDSYRHRPDYDDPMNLPQPQFDELCEQTRKRLGQFGDRFRLVREDSIAGAKVIGEQLDFVYLDADHSYEGVAADLRAWYPKIREGGVIAGHDYGHTHFPGVQRAVDEFFRRVGGAVQVLGGGVWWIEKTATPISFFIPAYNRTNTIAAAVDSIVATNKREMDELVIVDDGSTDGTRAMLEAMSERIPNLRLIYHSRNRGGSAARNTACENAKHPLLFCLDSDNILAPSSIAPLLEAMLNSGCDAAAFEELRYFKDKQPPGSGMTWKFKRGVTRFADYLSQGIVPGSSGNYLFSRESWIRAGGYPEAAGALDTWGFGLRQVATGSTIYVLADSFYNHRYSDDSYWERWSGRTNHSLIALSQLIPYLDQIDRRDIRYLFSSRGRLHWQARLDKRPIRVIVPKPYGRGQTLQHRLRVAVPPSVRKAIRSVFSRA